MIAKLPILVSSLVVTASVTVVKMIARRYSK